MSDVYYKPLTPYQPPANRPIRCGEWWGCPDWLVKGEPKFSADEYVGKGSLPKTIPLAEAKAAEAAAAALGPARWGDLNGGEGCIAYIPIGATDRYAANPDYLNYASAVVGVDEWRWLPLDDGLHKDGQPYTGAGVLVGVRDDGEVVAVVCPVLWNPPATPGAT